MADDVAAEIAPLLVRAEAEDARSIGDRLVEAVRAGGLGVMGLEARQKTLEYGQVDILVLDPDAPVEDEVRNALIRQATTLGAEVEVVQGHPTLGELGGVGALLRYRLDEPAARPVLAG